MSAPISLSRHFSLAEMTRTSQNIANTPTSTVVLSNLRSICANVLEPVRTQFGRPIIIHSGYRSPAVNKAVGGSDKSQHMTGEAVDFHVKGYTVYEVAAWISESLNFDQLILENFVPGVATSGWVHCSYSRDNRNQELTKFKGSKKYYPGIILRPDDAFL